MSAKTPAVILLGVNDEMKAVQFSRLLGLSQLVRSADIEISDFFRAETVSGSLSCDIEE